MSKKRTPTADELESAFEDLKAQLSQTSLGPRKRKDLEGRLQGVVTSLSELLDELHPIAYPTSVFDPGNPKIVGRFISLALIAQERQPLRNIPKFYGSGVYAIYYKGAFRQYASISGSETPIYVGKVAPAAHHARTPREQGEKLNSRLGDHKRSIAKAATTLDLTDFEYRSLVVQSGWEQAAEEYLIHLFQPLWNSEIGILYGFGKHGDSADTRGNKRSPWDTLHPGRKWAGATKLIDAKTPAMIQQEVAEHLQVHPAFPTVDDILKSFYDELKQV